MKNQDIHLQSQSIKVSGLLLYAKTDENSVPSNSFQLSGNQISADTLNLNCEFSEIAKQLNLIVFKYFHI